MHSGTNPVTGSAMRDAIEALAGPAIVIGRNRIAGMVRAFYESADRGAAETARVVSRRPGLASRLIAVANTIHHGAGIPATSVEAATVRIGEDRVKSLAIAHEAGQALASVLGERVEFAAFWHQCVVRGCIARAMAMNADPRIAGKAFLVGVLQDAGIPLLRRAEPADYDEILRRSEGHPLRLAVLEWQSFNLNHIHVGLELLRGWGLPDDIVEPVGRHHTNPPAAATGDRAIRLWQIGYLAGALPIGTEPAVDASNLTLQRLIGTALNLAGDAVDRLLAQAEAEYQDVAELFRAFAPPVRSVGELLAPAAAALDAAYDGAAAEPQVAAPEQIRAERAALNADSPRPAYVATVL